MQSVRGPAVALVALASGGCGEARAPEPEVIKVGLLSSFTGQDQRQAQKSRFAAELAVDEFNAMAGPLPGQRVELLFGNDELDGAAGARELARLIDAGIVALIGPESSRVATSLLALSAEHELPLVTCCATSDALTESPGHGARERYFFRTIPTDRYQAPVLARVMDECGACREVAVLHVDDDYGTAFAEALHAPLAARGIELAFDRAYDPTAANFEEEVRALDESGAPCVALLGRPGDAARIRRTFRTSIAREDLRWFGGDSLVIQTFAEELADPQLADDFLLTAPTFDNGMPSNAFRNVYTGTYRLTPDAYNARTYDAAALVLLAIARAGSTEGRAIRDALFEVSTPSPGEPRVSAENLAEGLAAIRAGGDIDYEGASGPVDFDEFGNVQAPYDLFTFSADGVLTRLGAVHDDLPLTCGR